MTQTTAESHYIGIDVGTGSVRASLVTKSGKTVASSTYETTTWRNRHDHRLFEQSTTDIWDGVTKVIKACLKESGVPPAAVKGLGFDATCSLAVADFEGRPIVVTNHIQNIFELLITKRRTLNNALNIMDAWVA
ncbi:hypothetical protein B0H34DRAFT_793318 [Crassisporium funariophilum]|nr:hypothetical protein B0H34DRAFT_793318 [Crassisporium funariophilum]